jgi:hypothetical protein
MSKLPGTTAWLGGDLYVTILPGGIVRGDSGTAVLQEYRFRFREIGLAASRINSILREALVAAGWMWIKVFLPKRFEPSYARLQLGYRSTKAYDDWKAEHVGEEVSWTRDFAGFTPERTVGGEAVVLAPQPTPFVLSGAGKASALSSAYPVATVTANRARLTVKLKIGAISFRNHDTFTSVPAVEYGRVLEEAERFLRRRLTGGPPVRDAGTTDERTVA